MGDEAGATPIPKYPDNPPTAKRTQGSGLPTSPCSIHYPNPTHFTSWEEKPGIPAPSLDGFQSHQNSPSHPKPPMAWGGGREGQAGGLKGPAQHWQVPGTAIFAWVPMSGATVTALSIQCPCTPLPTSPPPELEENSGVGASIPIALN